MKYLFLIMIGLFLTAILGCFAGLCLSLDFDKWSPWLLLLPMSLGWVIAFLLLCCVVIKFFPEK